MISRSTPIALALALLPSLLSCAASAPAKTPTAAAAKAPVVNSGEKYGQLEIPYAGTAPEGKAIKLNFSVRNPYQERIEGVRVIFRVTSSRDAKALEVGRVQQQYDIQLDRGDVKQLSFEALPQSRDKNVGTFLRAYAIRRGGETLPLPAEWQAPSAQPAK